MNNAIQECAKRMLWNYHCKGRTKTTVRGASKRLADMQVILIPYTNETPYRKHICVSLVQTFFEILSISKNTGGTLT